MVTAGNLSPSSEPYRPTLAEISRNTSAISSSSSEASSTLSLSLTDPATPQKSRPNRAFAGPRRSTGGSSASQARQLPSYIQKELGIEHEPARQTTTASSNGQSTSSKSSRAHNSPHDFDFGEILGHGSYSTVIRATDKKSGRVYALKVLDKAHLQRHNQQRTALAEKESLVVLGLGHPGIVGLHSTFQDAWSLYFVLDLVPNGDLRVLITRFGSLSLSCARYYSAQITDALDYIHCKGVIHRDVKPENLLLDERFRVKIADFGTSKVVGPGGRSRTFVGTPQYYSPELLEKNETTQASDWWALGCVLFEMIAGRFAFNGQSHLATWRMIKTLDYTFPDDFDADAADLVKHLFIKDPNARLGAGPDGSENSVESLRKHPFFEGIVWASLWTDPHPPLQSGLVPPPALTPDSGIPTEAELDEAFSWNYEGSEGDAELSAQLRKERMQDEEDEIPWAKDSVAAAYLPGLRYSRPGSDSNVGGFTEGNVDGPPSDLETYAFPSMAPKEEVEQVGEVAGPSTNGKHPPFPLPVSIMENTQANAVATGPQPVSSTGGDNPAVPKADVSVIHTLPRAADSNLPVEVTTTETQHPSEEAQQPLSNGSPSPPDTIPSPISSPKPTPKPSNGSPINGTGALPPAAQDFAIFEPLLRPGETVLRCSLLSESASGSLRRRASSFLPKLLSSFRAKARWLVLTSRRVLCVTRHEGADSVSLKHELYLPGVASDGDTVRKGGEHRPVVTGVELRGAKSFAILTNEKPHVHHLDDAGTTTAWVEQLKTLLGPPTRT
ncbi:Serine/threonine-protein kinase ksg1 [Hypsizygus marmoreus]|uniref:non-specific serine/threonine protein kinase n=1 Tax=Hypsizygus marmoreus TaxID=39966 RepID=A0A369K7T8_HYPMA|nr:Serine/threonine-protein kinase ksg1 [Hypsizygus marmoreus]